MFKRLKQAFSSSPTEKPHAIEDGALAPDAPLYVVGDVHGCLSELDAAIARIEEHAAANGLEDARLVLLGDYVDRGPQSAQVLTRIFELSQAMPEKVVCLFGNHERMMLEFVDDPAGRGTRWLRNGGVETLKSYDIHGVDETSDLEDLTEASFALETAMTKPLLAWLRDLPVMTRSGNIVCVHAGMDPDKAPEEQDRRTLIWGHKDFMVRARGDDLWVAHGHIVVKAPQCHDSRIALDTGAYRTGKLTVGVLRKASCVFI